MFGKSWLPAISCGLRHEPGRCNLPVWLCQAFEVPDAVTVVLPAVRAGYWVFWAAVLCARAQSDCHSIQVWQVQFDRWAKLSVPCRLPRHGDCNQMFCHTHSHSVVCLTVCYMSYGGGDAVLPGCNPCVFSPWCGQHFQLQLCTADCCTHKLGQALHTSCGWCERTRPHSTMLWFNLSTITPGSRHSRCGVTRPVGVVQACCRPRNPQDFLSV